MYSSLGIISIRKSKISVLPRHDEISLFYKSRFRKIYVLYDKNCMFIYFFYRYKDQMHNILTYKVLLFDSSVWNQALYVSSVIKSSHAFENSTGASALII